MKLSRQFTVFGSAIFCVVIFSLYLMLDRGHLDYPKSPRREGSFPQVSPGEWVAGLREGAGGAGSYPRLCRGSALGQGEAQLDGGGSDPPPTRAPRRSDGAGRGRGSRRLPGRAELAKCRAACGGGITPRGPGLRGRSPAGRGAGALCCSLARSAP